MLEELEDEAAKVGSHVNYTKTQFITNTPDADKTIPIHYCTIKTETYICLGQAITQIKKGF